MGEDDKFRLEHVAFMVPVGHPSGLSKRLLDLQVWSSEERLVLAIYR